MKLACPHCTHVIDWPLTPREVEVLTWLTAGLSLRRIADRLCIAEGTVKNHLSHIYAKLRVRNGREAMVRARQQGLLQPPASDPGPAL